MGNAGFTLPRDTEYQLDTDSRYDSSRVNAPVVDGDLNDPVTLKRLLNTLSNLGIVDDRTTIGPSPYLPNVAGLTPSATVQSAAGTTATATILNGTDDSFEVQVASAGTGQAAGSIVLITFAYPRRAFADFPYQIQVTPVSNAARSLAGVVGPTGRGPTGFFLDTRTALTAGQTYQWDVLIVQMG
jgi:hypothetical protein